MVTCMSFWKQFPLINTFTICNSIGKMIFSLFEDRERQKKEFKRCTCRSTIGLVLGKKICVSTLVTVVPESTAY